MLAAPAMASTALMVSCATRPEPSFPTTACSLAVTVTLRDNCTATIHERYLFPYLPAGRQSLSIAVHPGRQMVSNVAATVDDIPLQISVSSRHMAIAIVFELGVARFGPSRVDLHYRMTRTVGLFVGTCSQAVVTPDGEPVARWRAGPWGFVVGRLHVTFRASDKRVLFMHLHKRERGGVKRELDLSERNVRGGKEFWVWVLRRQGFCTEEMLCFPEWGWQNITGVAIAGGFAVLFCMACILGYWKRELFHTTRLDMNKMLVREQQRKRLTEADESDAGALEASRLREEARESEGEGGIVSGIRPEVNIRRVSRVAAREGGEEGEGDYGEGSTLPS